MLYTCLYRYRPTKENDVKHMFHPYFEISHITLTHIHLDCTVITSLLCLCVNAVCVFISLH